MRWNAELQDWEEVICRSTVVANIRRFELAVHNHAFRGTLMHDEPEAVAALEAVDREYKLAKARLLANISKRII